MNEQEFVERRKNSPTREDISQLVEAVKALTDRCESLEGNVSEMYTVFSTSRGILVALRSLGAFGAFVLGVAIAIKELLGIKTGG